MQAHLHLHHFESIDVIFCKSTYLTFAHVRSRAAAFKAVNYYRYLRLLLILLLDKAMVPVMRIVALLGLAAFAQAWNNTEPNCRNNCLLRMPQAAEFCVFFTAHTYTDVFDIDWCDGSPRIISSACSCIPKPTCRPMTVTSVVTVAGPVQTYTTTQKYV